MEFAEHGWDAAEIPDPQDPETFLRSQLDWDEVAESDHVALLAFYRDLIALRRNDPDMADPWLDHLVVDYDEDQHWIVMRRGQIAFACNLGSDAATVPVAGELILSWGAPVVGDDTCLPAHSVAVMHTSVFDQKQQMQRVRG